MAKKALPTDRYRLSGTYERLRKTLLELPNDGRIEKTLAYWVLPTDKRLPIAFLDSPLNDLLARPLEELMATPGVGQKKILGFFDLLRRAARAKTIDAPFGAPSPPASPSHDANRDPFDPDAVSEAVWSTWCETVNRCGFRDETLGRLAPSLQSLPTVIWQVPLGDYADRTLAKIRQLKTHGSKRVSAILEVFCTVHEAASTAVLPETIDMHLSPRFVGPVTRWVLDAARRAAKLTVAEIEHKLIHPLVSQTGTDLGPNVAGLVSNRLALAGDAPTVKQQADSLGVTRARIYQLLEDSSRAMEVRWPEGRWLLPAILPPNAVNRNAERIVRAAHELYFPEERVTPQPSTPLSHAGGEAESL